MYLYMVLLGCTPKGRYTEQHDIFFGIAASLEDLKDDFVNFWPEAEGKIHIDAWRKVTHVNGYKVQVAPQNNAKKENNLFFLNLGGYKPGDFEEYHYKTLCISNTQAAAIKQAKETTFYKHCGFKGAESHIDDKYGIDVDDIFKVEDILLPKFKNNYTLTIKPDSTNSIEDENHIGYLKLSALTKR